jgi:aldehyde:ferredoxin oxidoreductase
VATGGYAGEILRVDLTSGEMERRSTSDYADRLLGGRGLAAKIYWDEVPPSVGALEPGNRLIFATGPLGGVPMIGSSRWTICGKSAASETFSYCNMGGRWGAELKFAGFDAVVTYGKSDKPVYLLVDGDRVELKDASGIWGSGAIQTRETLKAEHGKSARVVAIGPAGENMVIMATFLADNDASGSGQLAASMGAKNLKAIVVKGVGKKVHIANKDRFRQLADQYRGLKVSYPTYGWQQVSRWSRDMVTGFRFIPPEQMKKDTCYGCLGQCARLNYLASDGTSGKFTCHSAFFYQPEAERYYGDWNEVPYHATKLCDSYGLNTMDIDRIINWLDVHYRAGYLTDDDTGIPLSKCGSQEYIELLLRKIAFREGIGDILAHGLEQAPALLPNDVEAIEKVGLLDEPAYFDPYGPRYLIMNGMMYAMEPTFPVAQLHEVGLILTRWRAWTLGGLSYISTDTVREIARRFWGSEAAADFTTYDGMALACKMIQDRQYTKECLGLCSWLWPVTQLEFTEDHVGNPTLESQFLSAVTGEDIDEEGLYRIGERVFNLQRALLVREGHFGREFDTLDERCFTEGLEYDLSNPDCIVPDKDGNIVSRRGEVVDREKWEDLKTEYYQLRRWDPATGLQTGKILEELDLIEVADDLDERGLLAAC